MSAPGTSPAAVGQQLARQRENLDLTQEDLGQRVGIAARTVSAVERGLNSISRSKRTAWEQALGLKSGTISRAYRDGTSLEPAESELGPEPDDDDLSPFERRILREMAEQRAILEEIRAEREAEQGGGGESQAGHG